MIGSPVAAAFIAFWGFWVLLLAGVWRGEIGGRAIATFLGLWLGGLVCLGYAALGALFTPYVATLDIALVFVVFKGDVRLW
jgi:hypothetical protein